MSYLFSLVQNLLSHQKISSKIRFACFIDKNKSLTMGTSLNRNGYELGCEKNNNVASEQVRQKPSCTSTEDG